MSQMQSYQLKYVHKDNNNRHNENNGSHEDNNYSHNDDNYNLDDDDKSDADTKTKIRTTKKTATMMMAPSDEQNP